MRDRPTVLLWNVEVVCAGSSGIIFDVLDRVTPNPGFKVTGYLKVEYLADGVRVFTHGVVDHRGSTENVQKNRGSLLIFFAKSAGRCFTPVMEIN